MKIDRTQNYIADTIMFIMAITIFYCGITTISFSYFGTNILSDLVDNWKKKPIIEIITANGSCPPSYELLYQDIWPGTVKGCYCNTFFDTIKTGSCSSKSSCRTVQPIEEIKLTYWDGILLCAKRDDKDYFFYSQQNVRLGCGLGMKYCGKLDNLAKGYCIEENEKCFINNIIIDDIKLEVDNETNNHSILLGKEKYLKFSNDDTTENIIIVDIKSSTGEVCIDPFERNTSYEPYKLLDQSKYKYFCTNKVSGNFYDNRYKRIDQCNLNDYYQFNRMTSIFQILPGFKAPSNDTKLDLFTRGYIGWHEACLYDEYLSPTSLSESVIKLNNLNFYQYAIFISSILYFILMCCLLLVKIIKIGYNSDDTSAEYFLIRADALNFIGILFGLSFAALAYSIGSGLANFFIAMRDSNCGDNLTNNIMFLLGVELNSNITKNLASLWLYIITIILIPINLCVMNYRYNDNTNTQMENYINLPVICSDNEEDFQ